MAVQPPTIRKHWPSIAGFDWDTGNRDKCRKHGLSQADIEALFHGPVAVYRDPEHSGQEERLKAIGKTMDGRDIIIVFTLRDRDGETLIRPISARNIHAKEVANYEKEAAAIGQR
jgi:uncharacterized protein